MAEGRNGRKRRIATYERVSSEDQRERQTIKTQTEELARKLSSEPDVELVERYVDDGVSGTVPMAERSAGQRLMADAARGKFEELWVYKIDRLGRDDVDPLIVWRELERLRVRVYSITEGVSSPFEYHIRVAMAAEERRTFLARSAAGMERAVREGRFPGGVCPIGYRVAGRKQTARLEVSDAPLWGQWTESGLVDQIFRWSAEGRSGKQIAEHLNALGVPTAYQKDGRCVRRKATRGEWTPGRINQILKNTTYKGIYQYGKRNKGRKPILVPVPAIVSEALWDAAQQTLVRNRLNAKNTKAIYPLRSLLKCDICGLNFSGTRTHGTDVWYRCNGQIAWRGKLKGACWAKGIKAEHIEPVVFADIGRWLSDPGDLLDTLAAEQASNGAAAQQEAERQVVESALHGIPEQRSRLLELYRRKRIDDADLDAQLDAIATEQQGLECRLAELQLAEEQDESLDASALLAKLRTRLKEGLSLQEKQLVASILVRRILIKTERVGDKKRATATIEYRFPAVVDDCTGRGSSRPRASGSPGT
jgi:site-specific DNA recombinase